MSLHVCVFGIDGCGKSTVVAALPGIIAAETGCVVGSAGDSFSIVAPDEDHLASRFHPDGLPLRARLALKLRRIAKSFVDHPKLYAFFKIAHMLSQDSAAAALAKRYETKLFISDGNAFVSTIGRASNYLRAASASNHATPPRPTQKIYKLFSLTFLTTNRFPRRAARSCRHCAKASSFTSSTNCSD